MTEVPGVETITGAAGSVPKLVELKKSLLKKQTQLSFKWNNSWIAMLPYCITCKEPLVWHIKPDGDEKLFHCPRCKRTWVKDSTWEEKEDEGSIRP